MKSILLLFLAIALPLAGKTNLSTITKKDYFVQLAEAEIEATYGETVLVKPKTLLKFGKTANADLGVPTTVMTLPVTQANETYLTTNGITKVSSSSPSDTQTITYEGHTISGTDLTFFSDTLTLNGHAPITLPTACARVTRAYNDNGVDLVGNVYFYEDGTATSGVPDVDSEVHIMIAAGSNQSEKAATAFSSVDYGIITSVYFGVSRLNTANVDCELQIREPGGVFRPRWQGEIRSTSASFINQEFKPYIIVPKNSDVRLVVTSTTNDTSVIAGFQALFALVQ